MTRHTLRSAIGTSFLVVLLALTHATLAADYPGAYFDLGGGREVAVVQSPGWYDLMGALHDCANGSDCTIMIAIGDQTFYWKADVPFLALTDAEDASQPAQVTGDVGEWGSIPGARPHNLPR